MTDMKTLLCAGAAITALALTAQPTVSDVTLAQDAATKKVQVTYTLGGEAAIVTLDIQTNATGAADGPWVSIGAANIRGAVGDVHRSIEPGARTIWWRPTDSWNGHTLAAGTARAVVKAWTRTSPPDYMVLDLLPPYGIFYYECAEQLPGGIQDEAYKMSKLAMRRIPAADVVWRMGSGPSSLPRYVPHYVKLSADYYMAVYETTQGQHHRMVDSTKSFFFRSDINSDILPADSVSMVELRGDLGAYNFHGHGHAVDAASGIAAVRARFGAAGVFDLPTEAQWEFAARAGVDGDVNVPGAARTDVGWFRANSGSHVWPVGRLLPNAYGLYDMQGNVGEWTVDLLAEGDAFGVSDASVVQEDPCGRAYEPGNNGCVMRGGDYDQQDWLLSIRDDFNVTSTDRRYYGYRLVCCFTETAPTDRQ